MSSGVPPAVAPGRRPAAFFDLDKTVIAVSATLAFGRPFARQGLIDRRAALRGSYAQLVYGLLGADAERMDRLRDAMAQLCTGWPVQTVRDVVAATLHDLITPLVYAEAVALIDDHHAAGRDVVVVSSSGAEVVAPICAMLGVDRVVATEMDVVDGRYTGRIAFYAYGPHKATAMAALAAEHGYDLQASFAYSDSITDLPMLDAVGFPHAVNPDRSLRRVATRRGWPVLDFAHPVPLRTRVGRWATPAPVLAAGTTVATTVAAAALLAAARRRARLVAGG